MVSEVGRWGVAVDGDLGVCAGVSGVRLGRWGWLVDALVFECGVRGGGGWSGGRDVGGDGRDCGKINLFGQLIEGWLGGSFGVKLCIM